MKEYWGWLAAMKKEEKVAEERKEDEHRGVLQRMSLPAAASSDRVMNRAETHLYTAYRRPLEPLE